MLVDAARRAPGFERFVWDDAWLAQHTEEALEPLLPIIDPHHHLWDRKQRYLLDELLADIGGGHNVRATVHLQCRSMYRLDAAPEMAPIGETEFVNGVAAMSASGAYGTARACAGIVGFADLTLGAAARAVLERHMAVAPDRFRGVRHSSTWHEDASLVTSPVKPPRGLLLDTRFREGFALLAPLGLSFDAWQFFTQLDELVDLARAFPDTTIVLDHMGGVLGIGRYEGKRGETFAAWRTAIAKAAACPNIHLKLGGMGMHTLGFGFETRPAPPTSEELAAAWKPYVDAGVEAFGPDRCMFESNFPVDKTTCGYNVLWNAFKRLAVGCSTDEKTALFSGTAARVYRLSLSAG